MRKLGNLRGLLTCCTSRKYRLHGKHGRCKIDTMNRPTLSALLNASPAHGTFIPRDIFPAYLPDAEMIAFIESCGDSVVSVAHDVAGCSSLMTTRDGFTLAFNGHLSRNL